MESRRATTRLPSTDFHPEAMVMVQLAQLDDTSFNNFVQLENASSACLILRYAVDNASILRRLTRSAARLRAGRETFLFSVASITRERV
jgi:hypothetical protein